MSPILTRYGPYFLYAYTVVLGLGVVAALGLTSVLARREGIRGRLDGAPAASAGALLGGRAVFVWLNQPYFAENPADAWQLWLGGLNYYGVLLGGLAGLWLWAKLTGRSFQRYAGLFAPGLALLAVAGWAACGVEGCAYGRAAAPGLLAANLPDALGVLAVRYRTQLGGAVASLVVFGAALWGFGRVRPGLLFWGTLGALSLGRAIIALWRGDVAPVVAGRRLDLLMDLGLLAVSLVAANFVVASRRRRLVG